MDDYLHLLIIVILAIFMIFYGGHNNQTKIEYTSSYFNNLKSIIIFETFLQKIIYNMDFKTNFICINEEFKLIKTLIPNYVSCYCIRILPKDIFNIYNCINKNSINTHMMIIFNHNKTNNLELLIGDKDTNNNNIGYYYSLTKTISITGIYHIYNNSNDTIYISCIITKKPYWYY